MMMATTRLLSYLIVLHDDLAGRQDWRATVVGPARGSIRRVIGLLYHLVAGHMPLVVLVAIQRAPFQANLATLGGLCSGTLTTVILIILTIMILLIIIRI